MSGFYDNPVTVERWVSSSVSAGTIAQPFVAPTDLVVVGLLARLGTAPGSSDVMTFNVSNFPTSQQGGSGTTVSAYNLWTATNVPSITGAGTTSYSTTNNTSLIENVPYPLNYPLPGPAGSTGYETAQATSQITTNPVTAPPIGYKFQLTPLVGPDNTYVDYNGFTVPASVVHAGDVLSFVVGGTAGAAANLEIVLFAQKR